MASSKPKLRGAYDDFTELSAANGLDPTRDSEGNDCPSKTQQHFAEDADINTIIRRFGLTGEIPSNQRVPLSGDFTNVGTYQEALDTVRRANDTFDAMPADIRERFGNDPAKFVAFCDDFEKNADEMIKMGLAVKRVNKPNEPQRVVIVDPTTGEVVKSSSPKTAS